jgi:hypothetical protein
MQSKGIKWTGDETGVIDPWNNPYYYDLTEDYYCIGSAGKDGTLNTEMIFAISAAKYLRRHPA